MHHFKLSTKKLNTLNEALDVLKMKPVALLSLCLTRMSYLLAGWKQAVKELSNCYDYFLRLSGLLGTNFVLLSQVKKHDWIISEN